MSWWLAFASVGPLVGLWFLLYTYKNCQTPDMPSERLDTPVPETRRTAVRAKGCNCSCNAEEGWDDETEPNGVVATYPRGEEVKSRIAFTRRMAQLHQAGQGDFFYQKPFGDEDLAAGILVIPCGGEKPMKNSQDNVIIFYVIQGCVWTYIHHTGFIIAEGGAFIVPRGNMYCIRNVAGREAKLWFTQVKRTEQDDSTN